MCLALVTTFLAVIAYYCCRSRAAGKMLLRSLVLVDDAWGCNGCLDNIYFAVCVVDASRAIAAAV